VIVDNLFLKSFVMLNSDEKEMILEWRNHIRVRQWMHNSSCITPNNHTSFIVNLEKDETNKYFLVSNDTNDLGVVYFNNITSSSADYGLYVNPYSLKKGTGSLLQEISIKYAFEYLSLVTLRLEVFIDNKKAIKLYEKFNFKKIKKRIIEGKEVLCMELKNENR